MNRRLFLGVSAASVVGETMTVPIIDTHIHLFDTRRPQGVPWPDKSNATLYRPALPARYRSLAVPLGVKGAIVIEASPWFTDNQWILDLAATDPLFVGVIGNLEPNKPEFAKQLEAFHRNPLFRGIRYGNLWGRDLGSELNHSAFISGMKLLAEANLTLDTANPTAELMRAVLRLTDLVPNLRVVLDHVPQMQTASPHLKQLASRPQVYVKLSSVYRRINGEVPRDLNVYRATLDELADSFGEDRILYGSDWPNSDNWRSIEDVLSLVQEYFETKPRPVAEKYFWKNSVRAYGWVKRDASQPGA